MIRPLVTLAIRPVLPTDHEAAFRLAVKRMHACAYMQRARVPRVDGLPTDKALAESVGAAVSACNARKVKP